MFEEAVVIIDSILYRIMTLGAFWGTRRFAWGQQWCHGQMWCRMRSEALISLRRLGDERKHLKRDGNRFNMI